jgi:hypothetical protein
MTTFEQICLVYRAMMESMTGQVTPETIIPTADKVWIWAKGVIAHEAEKQGLKTSQSASNGIFKTARITVKDVTLAGEGTTTNGRPWKRYIVTDTNHGLWPTFRHNMEAGRTYDIEYEENDLGRNIKKYEEVTNDL